MTLPTEDFDALPRPVDGNRDGVARRDMGAFEYQRAIPAAPVAGAQPAKAKKCERKRRR